LHHGWSCAYDGGRDADASGELQASVEARGVLQHFLHCDSQAAGRRSRWLWVVLSHGSLDLVALQEGCYHAVKDQQHRDADEQGASMVEHAWRIASEAGGISGGTRGEGRRRARRLSVGGVVLHANLD
jgi:hypothetical protein